MINVRTINDAAQKLKGVVKKTPLQFNERLSKFYGAKIYFKREDLQEIRSYKIRGAFNKMVNLSNKEKSKRIVTASAGNHAQGVALSCAKLKVRGNDFYAGCYSDSKNRKSQILW